MTRVYWDTMCFVYRLERHGVFGPRVDAIFDAMLVRGDRLCASVFSLCELLVLPHRRQAPQGAEAIETFFRSPGLELLPVPWEIAPHYANIRAHARVPSSDALHLAVAAHAGVDLFLTNDRRLQGLKVPGIDFIASLDTDLY